MPAIQTMSEKRWDSVYRNISLMRCNLRIKYGVLIEEWHIVWGRQELNRDKAHYTGFSSQNILCTYCNSATENEYHLYTQCRRLESEGFVSDATKFTCLIFGIFP